MHKVKLSRGMWYARLRTRNEFGASKMSAEHEITVVSSESVVLQAGILSVGNYDFILYYFIGFIYLIRQFVIFYQEF